MQYHEVKISVEFRSVLECLVAIRTDGDRITAGTGGIPGNGFTLSSTGSANIKFSYAQLYVDYVYLDTEERRRFAQESHEYLIDQLQNTGTDSITLSENASNMYRMNFNHPVKELVWVFQRSVNAPQNGGNVATNDWFNWSTADPGLVEPTPYTGDIMDPDRSACNILLNGRDRFSTRSAKYFRLVQPWQVHTRIPSKHIYVYGFGLNAEEHQPSGTCNFSRIDNAQLVYKLSDNDKVPAYHTTTSPYGAVFSSSATGTLRVYAVNYNVLRINIIVLKSILLVASLALLQEKQLVSNGRPPGRKRQMLVPSGCDIPRGRETPKAFATTFIWKHLKGTRLIAVPTPPWGPDSLEFVVKKQKITISLCEISMDNPPLRT